MTINDSSTAKGGDFLHPGAATTRAPEALLNGSSPAEYVPEPIAVVGMACRLPGESSSPHALWKLLARGGIAKNEAPESRFSLRTHHDGSRKPKTMRSPGGMFLENVDVQDFDAQFFNISRTDAIAMDPQQRQLLEVVYECLENAGLGLDAVDGAPIGCFVGSYGVDYADMQSRDPEDRAPSVTIGVGRAILSNRISHFLNIKGPSMTIDTACSGSLVSLDVACRYLKTREIDGAIVAGANLYLSPEHNMDGGAMKGASSVSGKCHTFDVKADGYIKAEGINAVIIKRLSDAIRDRDPIRAIIRGTATNSDGNTPGIASPSSAAQIAAIKAAYANAGIKDFNDTAYLECHGTGTQAGDPTEVNGAASILAGNRSGDKPLIIGSVKSNIGHSEPAAGISGLLKAILSIENGAIPGNPTFITPNPKIDWAGLRIKATQHTIPWPKDALRRASVNSFGYGGSNAHVVLEDAELWAKKTHISSYLDETAMVDDLFGDEEMMPQSTKDLHLVPFSANDEASLRATVKSLKNHLLNPQVKVKLNDLAFTLSEKRSNLFNRAFVVTDTAQIDENAIKFGKKMAEDVRIAFVFTGQGAQWSQMGKQIVENFPETKQVLAELDEVLQGLDTKPQWSLLEELTQARSPAALRQPEFSQPLVTALQIALLKVLTKWGIKPQSVVGHSSGEIAASYAAGLISQADAIKAAFFRGQASKQRAGDSDAAVGMMAVGLGPEAAKPFLDGTSVQIACHNSPQSVTLSGTVAELDTIRAKLLEAKHFARLLQVDLAYHSKYMTEIGKEYAQLLGEKFNKMPQENAVEGVQMFSTVHGERMDRTADTSYWVDNMVSPVLFEQGVKAMMAGQQAPNFMIEIGPSGALAGPISQILKSIPGRTSSAEYCAALTRGPDAVRSTFEAAGKLFLAGGKVDMSAVNQYEQREPLFVSDLPNYQWNHSTKYWYESEASKDWRYRIFPHHDLIGSKVLNSSYHVPTWKKTLNVDDLPWLKDHKMGTQIVFPAAGFMAMGMEAVYQATEALSQLEGKPGIERPCYRLRNVTFDKALVLEEGQRCDIMLTLAPRSGLKSVWHDFKVFSKTETTWNAHCHGLVSISEAVEEHGDAETLKPLEHATNGAMWYKAMEDAGYGFGPLFQQQLEVESSSGQRASRSVVSLEEPPSINPQSYYAIHPANMDGCLQTCAPSLWNGNRNNVNAVLVPAIIDDLMIVQPKTAGTRGIATATSRYVGLGRKEETKNYMSDTAVYDSNTGSLLMRLRGMRYHKLDTQADPYEVHRYSTLAWKPDFSFVTSETLSKLASEVPESTDDHAVGVLNKMLDSAVYKNPRLKVIEAILNQEETSSLWLESVKQRVFPTGTTGACKLLLPEAQAVMAAQEAYSDVVEAEFVLNDISKPFGQAWAEDDKYDIVIVRFSSSSVVALQTVIGNAKQFVDGKGRILLVQEDAPSSRTELTNGCLDGSAISNALNEQGFVDILKVPFEHSGKVTSAFLATHQPNVEGADKNSRLHDVTIATFGNSSEFTFNVAGGLCKLGWKVSVSNAPIEPSESNRLILVVDDLAKPLLPTINETQWEALKKMTTLGDQMLWVTEKSQLDVTNPNGAMIHGLTRVVRAEDPSVCFTTLDVEAAQGDATIQAIDKILQTLEIPRPKTHREFEYVERNGVLHISRVQPDDPVNKAEKDDRYGGDIVERNIPDAETTIRMICERVGTIDSLCFAEMGKKELPLGENRVEVELEAAGLNFKDVAITMGIVPENEHLLGLEGAGVIRRPGNTSYKVGQRVLVFEKGTFANRIIATTERVYPIPDSMTYEEASTLASVYLTAIYSLFDLANVQKGQRVLIHSATGGLGIASIQLCHYAGAEVYATVGTDEKVKFLTENFGIPSNRIFNSRSTAFATGLMRETNNEGVDIILNSLTGELLEESWRCIREGGTMVELGKRDMLDRNYLPMEVFGRNVSYRCFDMSHKHVSDTLIARLLKQLFGLLEEGHVKPIAPITTFAFDDIPSAFRHMRGANHIGKIVVTKGEKKDLVVPVRPAKREFSLRSDASYLLIGGLKGLCGSLAVKMARSGAKNIVVVSRSGYDAKSSAATLNDIEAEGAKVTFVAGDVAKLADVERAFDAAPTPVAGIVQGAMVLRDKVFTAMSIDEYYGAVACKLDGTWNLHKVSIERCSQGLDFFTLLSSISGLVGQKGQANYAAANVFLDSFARYRRGLGLVCHSVDLGAIEEVGYMSRNADLLVALDKSAWTAINEPLFLKICEFSLAQQITPINPFSETQMVTSIAVPQAENSKLLVDARFGGLCFGSQLGGAGQGDGKDGSKEVAEFGLLLRAGASADPAALVEAAVKAVNKQFMTMLRLSEPMEPGKPLSSYGMDSLAAVEFRNWAREELGAELTTLEISNASSLINLCEKITAKAQAAMAAQQAAKASE